MNINKPFGLWIILLGVFLLVWQVQGIALENQLAGYILAAGEGLAAQGKDGSIRHLKSRSSVYEGDTIITRTHGAQIRFSDGSLTSLRPETKFKIDTYSWKGKADGSEKGFFNLIKGGLRTITGIIGKQNKQNYQMKTPVATIGIRGTEYGIRFCSGNCPGGLRGLFGGVFSGAIYIFNAAGQGDFERGRYFYVPSRGAAPRRELGPPPFQFGRAGPDEDAAGSSLADNGGDDDLLIPSPVVTNELPGTTTYTSSKTTTMFAFIQGNNSPDGYHGVLGTVSMDSPATETVTLGTVTADLPTTTQYANVVTSAQFKDNGSGLCSSCDFNRVGQSNMKDGAKAATTEYTVNRGRWRDATFTLDGVTGVYSATAAGVSFIRSDNVTTESELGALSGITATFGGAYPTNINTGFDDVIDQDGYVNNSGIEHLSFDANFTSRTIDDFKIKVEVVNDPGGSPTTVNSGYVEQTGGAVSFTTARETGISLMSQGANVCTGCTSSTTMEGSATVEFLGASASSAMGAFELHSQETAPINAFVGVYVVDK